MFYIITLIGVSKNQSINNNEGFTPFECTLAWFDGFNVIEILAFEISIIQRKKFITLRILFWPRSISTKCCPCLKIRKLETIRKEKVAQGCGISQTFVIDLMLFLCEYIYGVNVFVHQFCNEKRQRLRDLQHLPSNSDSTILQTSMYSSIPYRHSLL